MINNLYSNVKFNDYVPTFETYEEKLLSIKNTYTTGYKLAEIYHDGISDAIYSPISNDSSNIPSYNDISTKLCAESSSRISNDDYLCSQLSSLSDIQPISNSLSIEYVDRTQYYNLSAGNITSNNTSRKIYILSNMFSYMNNQNIINLGSAILSLDAVPKFQVDALSSIIDTLSDLYDQLSTAYSEISSDTSTSSTTEPDTSTSSTTEPDTSTSSTTEPDNNYFCIEALEDGVNVKIKRTKSAQTGNFQIKLNDSDWKDVSWEDIGNDKEYDLINVVSDKSSMSKGDKLKFRNIDKFSDNYNTYSQLRITEAKAKVYGKLAKSLTSEFAASSQEYKLACIFNSSTSLVDASELNLNDIIISTGCYYGMFEGCTSLTSTPKVLPATTLADYCYKSMFSGCTSLKSAPKVLPATTLAYTCYEYMFNECSSLTSAPKLPATTLAHNCYGYMFFGCTSLISAPELPATTLVYNCYNSMFEGCTSLKSAPELPATTLDTLDDGCYWGMFSGCTSLTSAPELPATKLAVYCYESMFSGCTSLTSAPKLPATTINSSCYKSMFEGCTSLTSAPELPATEITRVCYSRMFSGCTSLKSAPKVLPATELADKCYSYMFEGCTSLISAPKLPATKFADLYNNCYESIFKGCTKITELHYPKSIENDSTFKNLVGSPNFGADNATVYYDL